jgi:hypothetical protein
MAGYGRARQAAVAAVLGCIILSCTACTAGSPAPAGHGGSSPADAGTRAAGATRQAVAARYLVIAKAGNRRLDVDFGRLERRDRNRLAAAGADLRDIAATERMFDRGLLRIVFRPGTQEVARLLYQVNEARAKLTSAAAASTSLRQLHAYEQRLKTANGPVEQAVRMIRHQLRLPPPSTS